MSTSWAAISLVIAIAAAIFLTPMIASRSGFPIWILYIMVWLDIWFLLNVPPTIRTLNDWHEEAKLDAMIDYRYRPEPRISARVWWGVVIGLVIAPIAVFIWLMLQLR